MANFGCNMFSEGFDYTVPPLLKNIDFWFWKARMKSFIKSFDYHMWNVFINDFDFKPRKDWTENEKKMFSLNIRAMQILYRGLTENDFQKIRFCSSAKDIWDNLDSIYATDHFVEVESVDSSSEIQSFTSILDEQLEVEIEEDKIAEYFHDSVNTKGQEESGSLKELNVNESDKSSSGAQDTVTVYSSNSCQFNKNNIGLHEIDCQSITDHISNLKHDGKCFGKKDHSNENNRSLYSPDHHNSCIKSHMTHRSIICNYCGRSGHISHTCNIRRNSNVRNKFIWIPKGQVRSKANNEGPKYKWVPKCPSSTSCVQIDSRRNGYYGAETTEKNPRVSHALIKRISESSYRKRTLGKSIAATSWSHHKKRCIATRTCSTSRMNYHRVPYNYLEKNKRSGISQASR